MPQLANLARDAQQALMLLRLNANKVIDRRHDDVAAKKAVSRRGRSDASYRYSRRGR